MFRERGAIPSDTAHIHPADPWAETAPLGAARYPRRAPYHDDLGDPPTAGRRMRPLALAGLISAIVISVGLVIVLLSPLFTSRQASSGTPNLPGLLEQPPGATLPPQAAPETPLPSDSPEPSESAQPTPTGNAAVEDAVVALVNDLRRQARCDQVRNDRRLREAARLHSADMATGGFLKHTGSDGSSAADRMKDAGYDRPLSENLARGFDSARSVVEGWLDSREQRRNMLDCKAESIGVGVAVDAAGTPYWTQVFGR